MRFGKGSVAIGERHYGERFLHEYEEMRAFRDLRPAIFSAVQPLFGCESADVRDAASSPPSLLADHPLLTEHRDKLVYHVRRLLATSTDRHNRDRILDALKAWDHDTSDLENATDVAARERYARLMAERASWGGRTGRWIQRRPTPPPRTRPTHHAPQQSRPQSHTLNANRTPKTRTTTADLTKHY
ncbi:hypothetical protein [Streptomyces yanii]|uniref:Uncharacterized protein n=1 Tax=Streptomyces yanii TaxID=78510 RepID=A0ABV5R7M9_9ACTN